MRKKLKPATFPLPKFRSEREEADYFGSHSVAEIWDRLIEVKPGKMPPALAQAIKDRHAEAKRPISIRLVPAQIVEAKKIAARKSVGYQTQLRMWIAEGIQREAKR